VTVHDISADFSRAFFLQAIQGDLTDESPSYDREEIL
jgi:hypothetical protein